MSAKFFPLGSACFIPNFPRSVLGRHSSEQASVTSSLQQVPLLDFLRTPSTCPHGLVRIHKQHAVAQTNDCVPAPAQGRTLCRPSPQAGALSSPCFYLYLGRVLGIKLQSFIPIHLASGFQHGLKFFVMPSQLEHKYRKHGSHCLFATGTYICAPFQPGV